MSKKKLPTNINPPLSSICWYKPQYQRLLIEFRTNRFMPSTCGYVTGIWTEQPHKELMNFCTKLLRFI